MNATQDYTRSIIVAMALKARVHPYSADPTIAWDHIKVHQTVNEVQLLKPDDPKPPGHTRFVCISDTHNRTDTLKIPDGDVLLHAGDFSDTGQPRDIEKFGHFLTNLPHQHKVVIAGNHDLTFDTQNYDELYKDFRHPKKFDSIQLKASIRSLPNVTYLEDSGTTINGIKIWGSPWQPEFCDWAFNLPRGEKCLEKWDLIPEGTDIVMTHGPPVGHGDLCFHGVRAGCVDLLGTLQNRVKPKYHIFGHIHEGYGTTTDGTTVFVNCSVCTYNYKPLNSPVVFDLPNSLSQ